MLVICRVISKRWGAVNPIVRGFGARAEQGDVNSSTDRPPCGHGTSLFEGVTLPAAEMATTGISTYSVPSEVVDAYATVALADGFRMARLTGPILRTRSVVARSILGDLVSRGQLSYHDIAHTIDLTGSVPQELLANRERLGWLLGLARVLAAQDLYPKDRVHAMAIYEAVFAHFGPGAFDAEQRSTYAQLLFLVGDYPRAEAVIKRFRRLPRSIGHYLRCDLLNPFVRPGVSTQERWLARLNKPFARSHLELVGLRPGDELPFDRLTATAATAARAGPMISVVMSAYRPDDGLITSVQSILAQSWENLELLIVDDASGPGYEEWFARCRALDDRVRVLRCRSNGGTYVARNAALYEARGEFVTFQDADDWSHPRRLERQLAPLLTDTGQIASHSLAVRAHDDLSHQWLGYPAQRINASSIMFRRDAVLSKVGYFDVVRKSADAEYAARMECAFGRRPAVVREPLAYTRLRRTSLSRLDFTLGWASPARIAYQGAYLYWHRSLVAGADPYLPREQEARPFPAPAAFVHGAEDPPGGQPHTYDVIFLDDWLPHSGPFDGALEEISTLTGHGLSVSIAHIEAVGRMTAARKHLDLQIQEAVNNGTVDRVLLDEPVKTRLLVVRDPSALQFPPAMPARLRPDKVVLLAAKPADAYPGLEVAYDPATCTENARRMFAAEVEWVATHPVATGEGDPRVGGSSPTVVPSAVNGRKWVTDRRRRRGRRPVVGRYDADNVLTWPDCPQTLLETYPDTDDVDVRIMGDIKRALEVLGRSTPPPSWLVYNRRQIPLRTFLYQLDFFVYFPSDRLRFPPLDTLARAMVSGAVVVLPPRFDEFFGEAAIYCEPAQVGPTVWRYYADADLFTEQVDRARAYVAEHHNPAGYVKFFDDLVRS